MPPVTLSWAADWARLGRRWARPVRDGWARNRLTAPSSRRPAQRYRSPLQPRRHPGARVRTSCTAQLQARDCAEAAQAEEERLQSDRSGHPARSATAVGARCAATLTAGSIPRRVDHARHHNLLVRHPAQVRVTADFCGARRGGSRVQLRDTDADGCMTYESSGRDRTLKLGMGVHLPHDWRRVSFKARPTRSSSGRVRPPEEALAVLASRGIAVAVAGVATRIAAATTAELSLLDRLHRTQTCAIVSFRSTGPREPC